MSEMDISEKSEEVVESSNLISNENEILKIMGEIQNKISTEIVPKLKEIYDVIKVNDDLEIKNGHKEYGTKSASKKAKRERGKKIKSDSKPEESKVIRDVPKILETPESITTKNETVKVETVQDETTDIPIRYTKEELLQMKKLGCDKMVNKLQCLKILTNDYNISLIALGISPDRVHPEKTEVECDILKLQKTPESMPTKNETVKVKTVQDGTVNVPIRYTKEELVQMKKLGCDKMVNKLQCLKILTNDYNKSLFALGMSPAKTRSNINATDKLLLTLLTLSNASEREQYILNLAKERSLILPTESFNNIKIHPSMLLEAMKIKEEHLAKEEFDKIVEEELKPEKIAELNENYYEFHFMKFFKDVLSAEERKLTISVLVDKLIESKRAYVVEGELRINARNLHEGFVTNTLGKQDIYIPCIALRNFALNGDIVKVLVKKEINENPDLKPEGIVLDIAAKIHTRQALGQFNFNKMKAKKLHKRFIPRDTKIPMIMVSNKNSNIEILLNNLYLVEISYWIRDQPHGIVIRHLGKSDVLEVENLAILLQNNLNPQPFPEKILEEIPCLPYEISEDELKNREDLRMKCIFTIDPEGARDLDDAVSCEILPNGNFKIGVHIADVSYFIKENSDLDMIVKDKATTIYLVDTVYHMLPVPLCALCSLMPGEDKFAYSVIWEMNENAEVINTRFTRSVINSCAKLTYQHAQSIIENPDMKWDLSNLYEFPIVRNAYTMDDVARIVKILHKLAKILRKKREENGNLKIDQPKLEFILNRDTGIPMDWRMHQQRESNQLIEEFMLLANISVAQYIYEKFPDIAILRNHNPPNMNSITKLLKTLNSNDIQIDASSSKSLSESMEKIISISEYPEATRAVLNVLVSKVLKRANYFCSFETDYEEFRHFALSIPIYTHFTSPIRRYADIMVHRVLNAALGYDVPPTRSPKELQQLTNNCNIQKYNAKSAGDDSAFLYFSHFLNAAKFLKMRAAVMGIYQYNFEVVLIEAGYNVKIYYKNLETNNIGVKLTNNEDEKPTSALLIFHKMKNTPVKIVKMNTELKVVVTTNKNKLVIEEIIFDQ